MLLWASAALAWTPGEIRPVETLPDVRDVAMGEVASQRLMVVLADDAIAFVDPATATVSAKGDFGGKALLMSDLDGNGTDELLVCGDGISIVRGTAEAIGSPIQLVDEPCAAIATLTLEGVTNLLTVSPKGRIIRWEPAPTGLTPHTYDNVVLGGEGAILLATAGDTFAVARAGTQRIYEIAPWGDSSFASPAPIAGLAAGPAGWTWLAPWGVTDVGRQRTDLVEPRAIASGATELFVAHETSLWNGTSAPIAVAADVLAAADVDGDDCDDVLALDRATGSGAFVSGTCAAAPAVTDVSVAAADPSPEPVDPPPAEPRVTPATIVLVRADQVVQGRVGERFDSRVVDAYRNAKKFALERGPPGMVITPEGYFEWTPGAQHVGQHEVEVIAYNYGFVKRRRFFTLDVLPADSEPAVVVVDRPPAPEPRMTMQERVDRAVLAMEKAVDEGKKRGLLRFQRCLAGVGGAGGATDNSDNWQNLGGPTVLGSGSAALALTCEGGGQPVSWFVGLDSAPTYFYTNFNGNFHHVATATFGPQLGNERFKAGAYLTGGFVMGGGGLRFSYMPWMSDRGRASGLELRLTGVIGATAGQAMLLYTWEMGRFRR